MNLAIALLLLMLVTNGLPAWATVEPPTDITSSPVSGTGLKYYITWNSSPGTTSSVITLSKDGQVYRLRTSGQSITPTFPSGGNWTISVVDRIGGETSPPTTTTITVAQNPPSDTPSGIVVQNGDGRIDLRWSPSSNNDAMYITWTDPITSAQSQIQVRGTFAALRGLQNNSLYTFTMAWKNAAGTGPSITVTGTPVNTRLTTPIAPDATAASQNSTNLSWGAVPGATYYATYYGPSNDFEVLKATRLPRVTKTPSILLTNVSPGWYAFVVPGNTNGLGVPNTTATPLPLVTAPQDPPTLTLSPDHQTIVVSWTGVAGANTYKLYYMPTPFSLPSATLITPVTSPYTISGLTNGTEYGIAVRGTNDAGDGPLSTVETATPVPGSLGFQGTSLVLSTGPTGLSNIGMVLPNGQVYFPYTSSWPERSVFFDPQSEAWTQAPTSPIFPFQVYHPLNDGRIIAMPMQMYWNTPYAFNPSTNTWTQAGSSPFSLLKARASTILPNGNIIMVGGENNAENSSQIVNIFNTSTYTWSNNISMPGNPRSGANAITLQNGKVLITGGRSVGEGGCLNPNCEMAWPSAQLYDPNTNTFSQTGDMIHPRYGHMTALLPDGRVLAMGGFSEDGTREGVPEHTVEIFNPTTNTWSLTGSLPPDYWIGAYDGTSEYPTRPQHIPVQPDGTVVVLAWKDTGLQSVFFIYNPLSGTWAQAPAGINHYPFYCSEENNCDPSTYNNSGDHITYLNNGLILVTGGDSAPRLYQ
jgi:hypothetical protein